MRSWQPSDRQRRLVGKQDLARHRTPQRTAGLPALGLAVN
jgi:hypothetical protein